MTALASTLTRAGAKPPPSLTPARSPLLQRKCACGGTPGPTGECEECRKKRLQRKTRNAEPGFRNVSAVPPIVHEVLHAPGQTLDAATRAFMEPRFGHDFTKVRVHTDAKAAESASAVNAQAGECAECSKKKMVGLQTKLKVNEPGDIYEREADGIADQVMATPADPSVSGAPPHIQRFSGQSNGHMDVAPASVDQALGAP